MVIGIIGGSGLYELMDLEKRHEIKISTPYGEVIAEKGFLIGKEVIFISRHQKGHKVPPHKVNYRANIYALFSEGANYVIATNAVGSLRSDLKPGTIILPDQIIDLTKNRVYTFFDGNFSVKMRDGKVKEGVVHTDMTEPYCSKLRGYIEKAANSLGIEIKNGGTYVCMEGPRFETPAEIKFLQIIGGDIVGMTSSPEVFLANELELCYASISVVTNYAAGMQKRVSHEEVLELFRKSTTKIVKLITETIKLLD